MNKITEMIMDWEGPYKLSDFFTNSALKQKYRKPGVYIWIEELPDEKRLSYVGRATGRPTLEKRLQDHYANCVGGLYTIPKEFRRSGVAWIPDWNVEDTIATLLSLNKLLTIVEDGFRYASVCHIYLWPATPDTDVKLIERNLLYDLKPTGTIWGTKSVPANRINIRHRSPHWLCKEIRERINNDSLFV